VKIAVFITCLTDAHYPRAGVAMVKVLERLGHEVVFPSAQTCCGQPMFNNGFRDEARSLAQHMIGVFEPFSCVVTPSGSCAAMVCEHFPSLFEEGSSWHLRACQLAAKTFEFSQFLTDELAVDLAALGVKWDGGVVQHASCHLRSIGAMTCGERLLDQIEGVRREPMENAEQCCGFGGTFSIKHEQISAEMVRDKVDAIKKADAETLVCSDAGCSMNIEGACRREGVAVRVVSLAEVIAEGMGLLSGGGGR
jgi:L-lactate dehydrogenase complex protein LldE